MIATAVATAIAAFAACGGSSDQPHTTIDAASADAEQFYTTVVQFTGTYQGTTGGELSSCNGSQPLYGYEPVGAGSAPVFIYLVGTGANYMGADVDLYLRGAAALGYVSASFDYDPTSVGDCTSIDGSNRFAPIMEKAECMFDTGSNGPHDGSGNSLSALANVCARADAANGVAADCSKGVVVMGHSQGGFLAIMARNFDARISAVVGLSDTDKANVNVDGVQYSGDFANCVDDPSISSVSVRALPSSRLLLLHGADDTLATLGSASNPLGFIQAVTGSPAACGATCLGSAGDGYYIVQPSDLVPAGSDGSHDGHCWMYDAPSDCAAPYSSSAGGLDPDWLGGKGSASAYAAVKFLDQFVTLPPPP